MLTAEVTNEKGSTGDRTYTANWEEVKTTFTEKSTEKEQEADTSEETITAGKIHFSVRGRAAVYYMADVKMSEEIE